jgi:proton translocating ATP synthase F1 alpha subunit
MDRAPVTVPLQTGLKVVDALIPVGRGQRELILGDRQTGKTAIALDTIINQKDKDVLCIYCAIGKQNSAVAKVIADLHEHQTMEYSIVVVATGGDPPGLQFAAPYAATTIAEYFMEQGRDVLVVYDDLTLHARAYRELSLLLRRPPGREAFPGDIFYIHSRLLERSTHLHEDHGGGSLTALPIVETEAQNISAYIPTNIISITDGQIYLSPDLFQKGILPAVDVGKSVSRVGGKTQLAAYRAVASDLRLSYSQFEELEAFARFGTRLDEETRKTLERGRRVRAILKQSQYEPIPVPEQIAALVAVTAGIFDDYSEDQIGDAEREVRNEIVQQLPGLWPRIQSGRRDMQTAELLKRNIKTAEDLHSVVKTMKALAAVNIRQYEKAVESLTEYNRTIEMGLRILLRKRPEALALVKPEPTNLLGVIVFGSDQGMCGQLNDQIVSHAMETIHDLGVNPENRFMLAVGLRVAARLEDAGQAVEKRLSIPGSIAGITPMVQEIVMIIEEWHSQRKMNRIHLFFNEHLSGSSYRPHTLRLWPVDLEWLQNLEKREWPTRSLPTFTMDWNRLFSLLIRQYLFVSLYRACAESLASENASRLASMQGAERNIEERLRELNAQFHQQRQMSITEELLDIVAGFMALMHRKDN